MKSRQSTPVQPIAIDDSSATISFRTTGGDCAEALAWANAGALLSADLAPWRTFRWWYGQRHYSGTYWSSTQHDHVIYESRLELSRLLYADFDPHVTAIAAQPFLLVADIDGKLRRHIPDFLLTTANGPVVVEVKPRHRLTDPKVAYTLSWARQPIEARGWSYQVWSEPPPVELANIRFLAGYRDERRINAEVLAVLRAADLDGMSIGQVAATHPSLPAALVRPAVCHLLWHGVIVTDLDQPLQSTSLLAKGVRA
jgi:hypothetical protein